ncbi:MAG TPA: hypothetical protein VM733_22750 [Thermoanaerobaculia bacterium]|nr:hypothetical protein [Thermoanaerobaculia bacterium]
MTQDQITFIGMSFVIIIAITLAAQFRWLRPGRVRTVLTFIAGVLATLCLWAGNIPPAWFDASKTGWVLAISLLLSAFVLRTAEERAFGVPLLTGMSLTLIVANVVTLVKRIS